MEGKGGIIQLNKVIFENNFTNVQKMLEAEDIFEFGQCPFAEYLFQHFFGPTYPEGVQL